MEFEIVLFQEFLGCANESNYRVQGIYPQTDPSKEREMQEKGGEFYLSTDGKNGFALDYKGEVRYLFSSDKNQIRGLTNVFHEAVIFGASEIILIDGALAHSIQGKEAFEPEYIPEDPKSRSVTLVRLVSIN